MAFSRNYRFVVVRSVNNDGAVLFAQKPDRFARGARLVTGRISSASRLCSASDPSPENARSNTDHAIATVRFRLVESLVCPREQDLIVEFSLVSRNPKARRHRKTLPVR